MKATNQTPTTTPAPATPQTVHLYRDNHGRAFSVLADGSTNFENVATLTELANNEHTPPRLKGIARDILHGIAQEEKNRKEQEENFQRCKSIADELENLAENNLYKCPHCGALVCLDFEEDEEGESVATCSNCNEIINEDENEPLSVWDYFQDCLDVEYITDAQKDYKAVKICVTWGGPSIYVDTDAGAVCLYWWGQNSRAYLSTNARDLVDEWGQSYFNI